MRKIFSFICAVALLMQCIVICPVRAQAAEIVDSGTCGENLTWTLDDEGTLTISGTGPMTDYESGGSPWNNNADVKSVVINEGVTSIGDRAFNGCSSMTSVTIPDTVITIGYLTFNRCSGLASITIPDGVTSIEDAAFQMCSGLTSVTIPGSVSSIGFGSFSMCTSLASVTILEGLTTIGQYAFQMCESLTSMTIPDSVTTIDMYAFSWCNSLESVVIPDSVTSVGRYAFIGCTGLIEFRVDENNSCYSSDESGVLYSKDKATLIQAPSKISGSYVIPDGVLTVDNYAFDGCSDLTAITIPGSVTTISYGAFSDCSGLESITIPNSVTSVGANAFYGCSSLASVTIPNSVTTIGDGVFSGCSSLTGIWVDENNPSYCSDESGILFNKDKTTLIQAPTTIANSYTVPFGVISIGDSAFKGCNSLTAIAIPNSVTSIGDRAFCDCSGLVSVNIPDSITSIGELTFCGCSKLNVITIPNGVTSIDDYTFTGCASLVSVTIPDGVTSIGDYAFDSCESLISVTIPASVTSIGYAAFSNCYNLANVFYMGNADQKNEVTTDEYNDWLNNATWHYEVVGQELDGKTVIYCPECDYYYDPNKAQGKNLSGTCGENLTWTLDAEGTLTISGVGPMADYEWLSFPWHNNGKIKNVIVEEGVTSIAYGAFFLCDHLTSVSIPSSVTFIGGDAFTACSNLTGIWVDQNNTSYSSDERGVLFNKDKSTLILAPSGLSGSYSVPNSVVYIDSFTFFNCSNLTSVSISASVASIGSEVFRNCSNLTGIWVDENNTSYSSDERGVLFDKDKTTLIKAPSKLSGSYVIPESVTSIQSEAFYGCGGLSFVTIPDAVSSIGDAAFAYCYNLTSVIIPDSVTTIGYAVFTDCSALTAITIPDSVTTIDNYAFYYCDNLKDVFYVGSADQKNAITVRGDNEALTDAVWHYEVEVREENGKTVIFCPECNCNYNPDGTVVENNLSGTCGENLTWALDDDGTLTILGTGAMDGYASGESPWYGNEKVKDVVIADGVTSITDEAFYGCTNLTTVTIPDSVTQIGSYAFYNCCALETVVIPASVTHIGYQAFVGCDSLRGIWVDENNCSYSSDESGVLFDCEKLVLICAPGGISGAYSIPDNVLEIGDYAFYGCADLTDVNISDDVSYIGMYAFYGCGLESAILPEKVDYIGSYAFYGCDDLSGVKIRYSVTYIGQFAFDGCTNLDHIFYGGDISRKEYMTLDERNEQLLDAQWHYEVTDLILEGQTVYYCTECGLYFYPDGTEYVLPVIQPTLTGKSFSLSFEDEILVNFYYTAENIDNVVEQGMLVFYADPGAADIAKADDVYNGSATDGAVFMNTTDGIAAKYMGDSRYYCAYAKLTDGSYAYSKLYQYSPKKYAMNMLGKTSTSEKQKALCVAMLNYGAAAQNFFGYKTDALMNSELTDEQKALVVAYDETLFTGAVPADSGKIANFTKTATGFSTRSASVSFEGAFSINYYFTPSVAVNGELTLYYWTPEDYAAATVLTVDNASGSSAMVAADGNYWGQVSGIAAKALDDTYYVAGVYTDAEGNTYCTGVIAYSLSKYCMNNAKPGKTMQELASATAMYGYYAKAYFS